MQLTGNNMKLIAAFKSKITNAVVIYDAFRVKIDTGLTTKEFVSNTYVCR